MRVLTVREPWLWAILEGGKNVENRSPGFAALARAGERIGLHGSTTWSKRGRNDPRIQEAYERLGVGFIPRPERVGGYLVHPVCDGFGLIVATALIDDVHVDADCCRPWGESEYLHGDGRTMVRGVAHVVLAEVQRLDPVIPARGRLGLWSCDELDEVDSRQVPGVPFCAGRSAVAHARVPMDVAGDGFRCSVCGELEEALA